jgi:hypothetical protein
LEKIKGQFSENLTKIKTVWPWNRWYLLYCSLMKAKSFCAK